METIKTDRQFRRYPAYKDSGVEWLGEIPEGWEAKPGFTIIKERKEKNVGLIQDIVLSLSYGNVIIKPKEKLTGLVPESFETYQLVYPGDIIVRPTDLQNDKTSLRTGLAKDEGIITNAYLNLYPIKEDSASFIHYFLHSLDNSKVLYGMGSGLRQNLDFRDFKRLIFPLPPLSEQSAIADFLDRKCAQIDRAIAQKERLIELLQERRQILIQQAVTRGLDPTVPMKDSGVDWIGEVPEGWEVKKLKFILKERNERSDTGDEPLLMMSQVHGLVVRADYHSKAEVAQSNIGNKVVYANDLVFNKLKAHLGVFFKSTIEYPGLVSPDYAVYYSDGEIQDLKYLELLFRNPAYISQFICLATGIVEGLIRLYTGDLFSIKVPVPPIREQEQILNYLEGLNERIDKAIRSQQTQVEKLTEFKATLINSAVTGKIKVK